MKRCRSALGWCLAFSCVLGCRSEQDDAPAPKKPPPPAVCPEAAIPIGFPEPAAAYTHYAEAINHFKWCDAIATFEPKARADVAVMTFKGLILLAGTDTPKRVAYQQNVLEFCNKHNLPYSPAGFAALTAKLLKRGNIDAELGPLKQVAAQSPEAIYVELLDRLKQVDAHSMMQLDPVLSDVTITGDTATGTSSQRNGAKGSLAFAKTNKGWLITVR